MFVQKKTKTKYEQDKLRNLNTIDNTNVYHIRTLFGLFNFILFARHR